MWSMERHDRITYLVNHSRRPGGGVITKQGRNKWHAESDDTGETFVAATLTKARFWIERKSEKPEL